MSGKKIDTEMSFRKAVLTRNSERAHIYYKNAFEKYYKDEKCVGKKRTTYSYIRYELSKKEYVFYSFEFFNFGENVAVNRIDYENVEKVRFNSCKFKNCIFQNIIFTDCCFDGCDFVNVNFDHVIFDNCSFSLPVSDRDTDISDSFNSTSIFKNCIFVSEFNHCSVDGILFERCNFTLTKFNHTSMLKSLFDTCAVSGSEINDCNLQGFGIYKTDILDIAITDERLSKVDQNTIIDCRIICKRERAGERNDSGWRPGDFDDMCLKKSMTIRNFSRLFGLNGYPKLEGELFYSTKVVERKALHKFEQVKSSIALALCGYGERPSYTLITLIVSIVLFGIVYMFTGIRIGNEELDFIKYPVENFEWLKALGDFGKCFFFSLTTFSTVGYGNYVPLGAWGMFFSGIQMIWGVSLCALWTGCIFRKIAR